MNRIQQAFDRVKETGQPALLPYLSAGSPSQDALIKLLPALQESGASIVEIGFPYSDPVADGPTISASMHKALEEGMTPELVFSQVKQVRDSLSIGLVAMVSVSIVHAMGGAISFAQQAKEAGFDGLIIPDLAYSESKDYIEACKANGLTLSLLISPTTPTERAIEIANTSTGFVYLLARTGITGEQSSVPDISKRVKEIRASSRTPIACGFGISTPEHVQAIVKHADGAIVGSALVRRLRETFDKNGDYVAEAEHVVAELATGLISMDNL